MAQKSSPFAQNVADELKLIRDVLANGGGTTIYGFHINSQNSDPSGAVTYLNDAVGMTPAKMDFANDVFDWGSWGNAFFLPRPCMLKYDGTVDYYLDEDDYTKKADGTASDIADTSYQGNAMMEWGRDGRQIWTKVVPNRSDENSCEVYIANYKADDDFHAWSFINSLGNMVEHFYTPIYNGSEISGKLRSMSGQTVIRNKTASQEIELARANFTSQYPIYNIDTYCDVLLINYLLVLVGKSLNTQAVFGLGNQNGYSGEAGADYGLLQTGTMNTKGMFWGKNTSSSADNSGVKIFGMENWWANQYRRTAGIMLVSGQYKIKMCYGKGDGSTVNDYNLDANGYVDAGESPTVEGYVSAMKYSILGSQTPSATSAASTTYYSDYLYQEHTGTCFALRGGHSDNSFACGAFYWVLGVGPAHAYWDSGASPSCKPLS